MAAYPKIDDLEIIISQFPYGEVDEHAVIANSLDCGVSYTWHENLARLRRFKLVYPVITRAQAKIIEDFYREMRGRTGEFEFTDSSGKTWHRTRFDMDVLKVTYAEFNHMSLNVELFSEWDPTQDEPGGIGP